MKLVDLPSVKALLGINGMTEDARLDLIISLMSAAIERDLNRTLTSGAVTQYWDGGEDGRTILGLERYPNVTSLVLYDDTTRVFGVSTIVPATEYVLIQDDRRAVVKMLEGYSLDAGIQNIKATYTAGYSAATNGALSVPDALKTAALLQVGMLWQRRDSLGMSSVSHEGGNVSMVEIKWLPQVREILDHYKRRIWD